MQGPVCQGTAARNPPQRRRGRNTQAWRLPCDASLVETLAGGSGPLPSPPCRGGCRTTQLPAVRRAGRAHRAPGREPPGWGADYADALERNGIRTTRSNVCSVMAVIGQELTFTANPEVKGLGSWPRRRSRRSLRACPASGRRGRGVEMVPRQQAHAREELPHADPRREDRARPRPRLPQHGLLPVPRIRHDQAPQRLRPRPPGGCGEPGHTLGSMQVSVAFVIAEVEKAKDRRLGLGEIWELRDELYTRQGGRGLWHPHAAGLSRRLSLAALCLRRLQCRPLCQPQCRLPAHGGGLSGTKLALDGDLLIYEGGARSRRRAPPRRRCAA